MSNENDIYNSSNPGGGGGGGNDFFHVSFAITYNTLIDYNDNKIKPAFNYSNGGLLVGEEINLNGKSNIEFQISYYVNNNTSPSRNRSIVSYKARNSYMEYGKLFTIFHDVVSGAIDVETATTQTGFFTGHTISGKPANNSYKIKVNIDLNTKSISVYVNDVFAFTDSLGSIPEYWQPSFFSPSYYEGSYPSSRELHVGEYIDIENTYLKIDNVLYLGL